MGGTSYSDDYYTARVEDRKAKGIPAFDYDDAIHSGKVDAKVHDSLDPKKLKNGVREARDSSAHPESTPIIGLFDQTGSMRDNPRKLQSKLPQLMGLLLRKGYVKDPAILFGCFGDYFNGEKAPFQVGQFESGIEMDDDLNKFYLEGNGGGQTTESYEACFYFAARKTVTDAWEKRKKKGYMFVIGDEKPFPALTKDEAEDLFGDKIQADIPIADLVKEAQEKWEIFFLIPEGSAYSNQPWLRKTWSDLLDSEHVISIKPELVCEAIGSIIGLMEGNAPADKLVDDLKSAGIDADAARIVSAAVDPLAKSLVPIGRGTLPAAATRSGAIDRF